MCLLFYDDSPTFGGHEVMTLLGVQALLQRHSGPVHFLASSANTKLCEQLTAISRTHPHLHLRTLAFQSSKFEAIRNRLLPARISQLARIFLELKPSLVIAVQGNIEHSSLSLHAARRAGIRSTSYIPVPHTNAEMGAKLGKFRDVFCTGLFQQADSFITITDEMERLLKLRGVTAPTHIVYNGVDTARFKSGDRQAARASLKLPPDQTIFAIIGRIEFRQKQQQLLVQAISTNPNLRSSCHLVFAGDGPDADSLQSLIQQQAISATILPWSDPALIYQAINALIIPSRYEGLPLVMLEALASNTAVLASNRDGMKDVLPPDWRFTPNNHQALAATLTQFIHTGCPPPDPALTARIRESMSLDSFSDSFSSTLLKLARTS
jgi:glycosyltransferase involved in cell wall biosynthesis